MHQETDHIKTNESSPGTLSRMHQETDHIKTNKSSPGTLSRVHQETDHIKTNESSRDTFPGAPGTDYMKTNIILGHKYMYTLGSCQHLSSRDCLFLYIVANMWQSPEELACGHRR